MPICVRQSQDPQLHQNARCKYRRRFRAHHFFREIPLAQGRIELQLKFGRATKMQRHSDGASEHEQQHRRLKCAQAGGVPSCSVPNENADRDRNEKERNELCRFIVVLE